MSDGPGVEDRLLRLQLAIIRKGLIMADARHEVQEQLHAVAQLLREAHKLGPEAQALLADLVDELGRALETTDVPHEEISSLTKTTSEVVQAVHDEPAPGMIEAAEERLERAAVVIESRAPALANLTRRLAEMLSDLGI